MTWAIQVQIRDEAALKVPGMSKRELEWELSLILSRHHFGGPVLGYTLEDPPPQTLQRPTLYAYRGGNFVVDAFFAAEEVGKHCAARGYPEDLLEEFYLLRVEDVNDLAGIVARSFWLKDSAGAK